MNQLPELAWAGGRLGWGGQGRDRAVLLTGVAALAVALIVVTSPVADQESGANPWMSLRDVSGDLHWRSWWFVPVVAALAGVHYLLAGTALRAAAGTRLGRWETTLAQLAAAAANRVVPAGLGAAGVNVRYLCRRGLAPAPAVGAVGAVGVLGALADGLLLLVVVLVGTWAGISGGRHELSAVGIGLWRLVDWVGRLPGPAQAALVLAVVVVVGCLRLLHRSRNGSRRAAVAGSIAGAARHAVALRRRPRDLILVMTSSAGTTLVLGVAFAVCTVAVSGATRDAGTLVVAYLVAAGAAAALPIPSGLGSTEAALVAALVAAHIRASEAVQAVLIFRLVTFWAPVPLGILAAHTLRKRRAL